MDIQSGKIITMLKPALLLAILCIFCLSHPVSGQTQTQTRSDLERERAAIQQEIENVKKSLDENKKNKKETLGQLALLQRRLRLRQQAISNINQQINFIQTDINNSWQE